MSSFEYTALDLELPSFRLLRLIGGQGPTIECEIFQSYVNSKNGNVPYEALSYTWGSPDKPETILVDGKILNITINLRNALNHLRLPASDRILWIDALCINQDNFRERNHQVGQMTNIYKNADAVIYWLGQPTYATNVALDSLKTLEKLSASVACSSWKYTDERWRLLFETCQKKLSRKYSDLIQTQREGLQDLLERPWFERVWIIQEVANSKRGILCCGAKAVSARVFGLAPHLFAVKPSTHTQAILDVMPGRSRCDSWWGLNHDLYTLLCKFGSSKAQDPRDMVYALLGIASDSNVRQILRPDYEKTERDVIRGCVAYLCNLDIDDLPEETEGFWNGFINDEDMQGFLKSVHSLYTAAVDQHIRAPDECESLEFVNTWGSKIRITNENLVLAGKTGQESESLLKQLITRHADQDMLLTAASNWQSVPWMEYLLEAHPPQPEAMESLIIAAMKNPSTEDAMRAILSKGAKPSITRTLTVAAASCPYPGSAIHFLLDEYGEELAVTEEMVLKLANNESWQSEAALRLLGEVPNLSVYLQWEIIKSAGRKRNTEYRTTLGGHGNGLVPSSF